MPTIRIDDEVYQWLQSQAVPFDDNPNSVLRRIAKLSDATSSPKPSMNGGTPHGLKRRKPMANGEELIERWRIPAKQARFHHAGTFFGLVTKFPAALCDPNGYCLFETERDLKASAGIKIGKRLNVTRGIRHLPGYKVAS